MVGQTSICSENGRWPTVISSTGAPVNPSDNSNIAHLSFSDLAAMSAKTLHLHLKHNKLSTVQNYDS